MPTRSATSKPQPSSRTVSVIQSLPKRRRTTILPAEHENTFLRIGQEALTNAVRYSGAARIVLRLRFGDDWVTLNVRDDGRGFDVAERVGKGFGITGMHERVAALGGSLTIDSQPGEGTEVSATLPT